MPVRKGDISELCKIAAPHISVVTNIGRAHLESFGSVDNIFKTKSEIISGIRPKGIAILNGDDEWVSKMGKIRSDIDIIKVGTNHRVYGYNISYYKQVMTFDMYLDSHCLSIELPLLGRYNLMNYLLAAACAYKMGVCPSMIKHQTALIKPVPHRLELRMYNGFYILDDAFNSNPLGAVEACRVMASLPARKRYVVTPGMVELGDLQDESHRKFGTAIALAKPDKVFLIGKKRTIPIYQSLIKQGYSTKAIKIYESLAEAQKILNTIISPGDIVLYENDLPDIY